MFSVGPNWKHQLVEMGDMAYKKAKVNIQEQVKTQLDLSKNHFKTQLDIRKDHIKTFAKETISEYTGKDVSNI